jgi:hypothetical protein
VISHAWERRATIARHQKVIDRLQRLTVPESDVLKLLMQGAERGLPRRRRGFSPVHDAPSLRVLKLDVAAILRVNNFHRLDQRRPNLAH